MWPRRGFYSLNAPAAFASARQKAVAGGGGSLLATLRLLIAQLIQLITLVAVLITSILRQLQLISGGQCVLALSAALASLTASERIAPEGAFLARALHRPQRSVVSRTALAVRTPINAATDVAAGLAAASLAHLAMSGGGVARRIPAKRAA